MNFLIWLIVGGIVGWLASLIMRTDAQQGILLNVVVGIIGAFIGGWVVSPMVGVGTINEGISISSILVSLLGVGPHDQAGQPADDSSHDEPDQEIHDDTPLPRAANCPPVAGRGRG